MKPIRPDSDAAQYADVLARLKRLEEASAGRTLTVTAASVIDLGAIDGDNITGVRISLTGQFDPGAAGHFMVLQPNGLSSVLISQVEWVTYWGHAAAAMSSGARYGSDAGSAAGLPMVPCDFTGDNAVASVGTFFTARLSSGWNRHYIGQWSNMDLDTDRNNFLTGIKASNWRDQSTLLTSLSIACTAGTFTGRICTEILP